MANKKKTIRKAQRTRTQIARLFAMMEHDNVTVADILRTPPACLDRILIFDVLRRSPHLGKDGAEKVLKHAKVWPLTRTGSLSPEERSAVIAHLPPRAKG